MQVVPKLSEVEKKTISKVEMSCQGCASPRANDNSPCFCFKEPSGTLHASCGSVITSFGSAAGTAMRSWNHLLSTTPWSGKKRSVQLYLAPLADLLQCWIVMFSLGRTILLFQLNSVQFFSEQFIYSLSYPKIVCKPVTDLQKSPSSSLSAWEEQAHHHASWLLWTGSEKKTHLTIGLCIKDLQSVDIHIEPAKHLTALSQKTASTEGPGFTTFLPTIATNTPEFAHPKHPGFAVLQMSTIFLSILGLQAHLLRKYAHIVSKWPWPGHGFTTRSTFNWILSGWNMLLDPRNYGDTNKYQTWAKINIEKVGLYMFKHHCSTQFLIK